MAGPKTGTVSRSAVYSCEIDYRDQGKHTVIVSEGREDSHLAVVEIPAIKDEGRVDQYARFVEAARNNAKTIEKYYMSRYPSRFRSITCQYHYIVSTPREEQEFQATLRDLRNKPQLWMKENPSDGAK